MHNFCFSTKDIISLNWCNNVVCAEPAGTFPIGCGGSVSESKTDISPYREMLYEDRSRILQQTCRSNIFKFYPYLKIHPLGEAFSLICCVIQRLRHTICHRIPERLSDEQMGFVKYSDHTVSFTLFFVSEVSVSMIKNSLSSNKISTVLFSFESYRPIIDSAIISA